MVGDLVSGQGTKEERIMQRSYDEFVERIRQALVKLSFEDAERASIATLSTLSEAITPEAAKNLSSHLPAEMADKLDYEPPEEQISMDEFLDIVAEKEGTGVAIDEARNHAIAVMKAVRKPTA